MVDLDCSVCLRFHHGAMVFDLDPLQGSRNFEDFQVMEFCLEGAAFDKKRSGNIDKLSPEVLELKLLRQIPLGQETVPHPYIYMNIVYIDIYIYVYMIYLYECRCTRNYHMFTGAVPYCATYASKYVWNNLHLRA